MKVKDKEMWKAQMKLLNLKATLKDLYKKNPQGSCYSVIVMGAQVALLKLPEYKIMEWFEYSLEGVRKLEETVL